MSFFVILILGVIQGLTEFLPVSSSGHLVVLYNIFGIENDQIFLSIVLHLATLFAVIIYYRKSIFLLIKKPFCKTNIKLGLTTIITCLVVLILKPFVYDSFDGKCIFIFFIITAFMLFISDYLSDKYNKMTIIKTNIDITNINISYLQSIVIGITQGISRSGSTIAVSKMCGIDGTTSATYSFLISIPIIIASLILEIANGITFSDFNISLIISMIVCFLVGFICIKVIDKIANKNKLSLFGYYLLVLSTVLIFNNLFLHWF